MIAIDFKKAFDSASREFLFRTLSAARFGSSFIQWIHTFYNNISSCVSNNGLRVHFTYDRRLRRKLNFDEITKTIKDKLRIWKWRNLTIIGRIQLVKTFIIPTFLYRASLICMDREFVNEVNKIIAELLGRAKRAQSGAPWVRKFGKLSI